jgi:lipopolysaccharide export system permease protein
MAFSQKGGHMTSRIAWMIGKMITVRFLAIMCGLTLFILTLEVVTYANEILALENSITIIPKYLAARAPATLATFLPMSLLLALLLTITELSYRNEITAIWALGISPLRLVMMIMPLSVLIGVLHFGLLDRAMPTAAPVLRSWGIADYGEKKLKIGERDPIWLRSGNDIMRAAAASADSRRLEDVVIFKRNEGGLLVEQIFAVSASLQVDGWHLQNAVSYPADGTPPVRHMGLIYAANARPAEAGYRSGDPEEMSMAELSYFISNDGFGIRPAYVYQAWWHKRLTPFAIAIVMVALCVPLATRFRRGGGLGFLFAVGTGLGFAFFVLDGISMSMGELGFVWPWLAAWFPVLLFACIAVYMLSKTEYV